MWQGVVMDDETRDELLLAVARAMVDTTHKFTYQMQLGRIRGLVARAENTVRAANEVIEATDRSEC